MYSADEIKVVTVNYMSGVIKRVVKGGTKSSSQLRFGLNPVPRLIFAKIPVTKSKIPLLMIICKIMRIIN